ncbi:MAG: site-specific DNA-methyltransferase [Pseudomonadota bacterium]
MSRVEVIGSATLYLGDCRDHLDVIRGGATVVSDPPYGMAFRSNHRIDKYAEIANDDSEEMLLWACSLQPSHSMYLFCRWDNLAAVPKPKSCLTWVKENHSMGDLEHELGRQTEIALFYPGPEHDWPSKRPADVIRCPRTGNENHPTEKPVALMSTIIGWTRGMVVDPFMGSGSTGVACARANRAFVGIEIDETHFDTACRRIDDSLRQGQLFGAAA